MGADSRLGIGTGLWAMGTGHWAFGRWGDGAMGAGCRAFDSACHLQCHAILQFINCKDENGPRNLGTCMALQRTIHRCMLRRTGNSLSSIHVRSWLGRWIKRIAQY